MGLALRVLPLRFSMQFRSPAELSGLPCRKKGEQRRQTEKISVSLALPVGEEYRAWKLRDRFGLVTGTLIRHHHARAF